MAAAAALPVPTLPPAGKEALDTFLHETVQSRTVPATFFGVTTAEDELYFAYEGDKVFGQPEQGQVDEHTTMMLFSTSKFITSLACLQQVETGLLALDNPDLVARLCPELGTLQVLEGFTDDDKPILRDQRTRMTLRMLLNHTSGLTYPFNSPLIAKYMALYPSPPIFGAHMTPQSFMYPLHADPGTHYQYSIGLDWAGILLSRALSKPLEAIFQENIFAPCGVENMSFIPRQSQTLDRMMAVCERVPPHTGEIQLLDGYPFDRAMKEEDFGDIVNAGGGLFGTAREYLTILRHVLRSASPAGAGEPKRLINPETFRMLFTDSVNPDYPEIYEDLARMAAGQHIHDPALLDGGKGTYVGHSPALFVYKKDSCHGRKAGSAWWDGAAKTMFWLDPASGIAAVCHTNLMSHNPDPWNKVFNRFERIVYDHLQSGGA